MSVDWITVSAQIINFLVLVWLLKRFLYKPVLAAMAARDQRVTQGLKEAVSREQAAASAQQHFLVQQQEFEAHREQRINQVKTEAEETRKQLLDQAREQAMQQNLTWTSQQQAEQRNWANKAQQQLAQSVIATSQKVLHTLSDQSLERAVIEKFKDELSAQSTELPRKPRRVSVSTGFNLNVGQQGDIYDALKLKVDELSALEFITDSSLIAGIEVNIDEFRYAWNINHFINELQQHSARFLSEPQRDV